MNEDLKKKLLAYRDARKVMYALEIEFKDRIMKLAMLEFPHMFRPYHSIVGWGIEGLYLDVDAEGNLSGTVALRIEEAADDREEWSVDVRLLLSEEVELDALVAEKKRFEVERLAAMEKKKADTEEKREKTLLATLKAKYPDSAS